MIEVLKFKSWGENAIKQIGRDEGFLKQHLMYLSQTNDLNKLHYIFDVNKFSNREKILEQFKKMYINNVDKVLNNMNSNLRASIFGRGSLSEQKKIFEAMIRDSKSPLYNFIK